MTRGPLIENVEWHVEWRFAEVGLEPDTWKPHYRCYSEEAAVAAVTELRQHPSSVNREYRVVRRSITEQVTDL